MSTSTKYITVFNSIVTAREKQEGCRTSYETGARSVQSVAARARVASQARASSSLRNGDPQPATNDALHVRDSGTQHAQIGAHVWLWEQYTGTSGKGVHVSRACQACNCKLFSRAERLLSSSLRGPTSRWQEGVCAAVGLRQL